MVSRSAGASAIILAVLSLWALGATTLGCETGALLGEPCKSDDECVTGVCRGGKCIAPLTFGTNPAVAQDAGADVQPDAEGGASDAAEDATGEDAAGDAGADVEGDVADAESG